MYCKLIAKSDNKIKTTWNTVKKETGKLHLTEQMPSVLINNDKVKDKPVYKMIMHWNYTIYTLTPAEVGNLDIARVGKK
jgi:hypothetical protein